MRQVALASGAGLRVPAGLVARSPRNSDIATTSGETPDQKPQPVTAAPSEAAVKTALADCRFEIAAAARRLGMSRQSLYRRVAAAPDLRLAADVPLQELLQALEDARGDLAQTALRLEVSAIALRARLRGSGLPETGPQKG